jgi:hypothetical protein
MKSIIAVYLKHPIQEDEYQTVAMCYIPQNNDTKLSRYFACVPLQPRQNPPTVILD